MSKAKNRAEELIGKGYVLMIAVLMAATELDVPVSELLVLVKGA